MAAAALVLTIFATSCAKENLTETQGFGKVSVTMNLKADIGEEAETRSYVNEIAPDVYPLDVIYFCTQKGNGWEHYEIPVIQEPDGTRYVTFDIEHANSLPNTYTFTLPDGTQFSCDKNKYSYFSSHAETEIVSELTDQENLDEEKMYAIHGPDYYRTDMFYTLSDHSAVQVLGTWLYFGREDQELDIWFNRMSGTLIPRVVFVNGRNEGVSEADLLSKFGTADIRVTPYIHNYPTKFSFINQHNIVTSGVKGSYLLTEGPLTVKPLTVKPLELDRGSDGYNWQGFTYATEYGEQGYAYLMSTNDDRYYLEFLVEGLNSWSLTIEHLQGLALNKKHYYTMFVNIDMLNEDNAYTLTRSGSMQILPVEAVDFSQGTPVAYYTWE